VSTENPELVGRTNFTCTVCILHTSVLQSSTEHMERTHNNTKDSNHIGI